VGTENRQANPIKAIGRSIESVSDILILEKERYIKILLKSDRYNSAK
jgi:hypothetical protein